MLTSEQLRQVGTRFKQLAGIMLVIALLLQMFTPIVALWAAEQYQSGNPTVAVFNFVLQACQGLFSYTVAALTFIAGMACSFLAKTCNSTVVEKPSTATSSKQEASVAADSKAPKKTTDN